MVFRTSAASLSAPERRRARAHPDESANSDLRLIAFWLRPAHIARVIVNECGLLKNIRENAMTWTTPKAREISCGMEINMYAPAEDETRGGDEI